MSTLSIKVSDGQHEYTVHVSDKLVRASVGAKYVPIAQLMARHPNLTDAQKRTQLHDSVRDAFKHSAGNAGVVAAAITRVTGLKAVAGTSTPTAVRPETHIPVAVPVSAPASQPVDNPLAAHQDILDTFTQKHHSAKYHMHQTLAFNSAHKALVAKGVHQDIATKMLNDIKSTLHPEIKMNQHVATKVVTAAERYAKEANGSGVYQSKRSKRHYRRVGSGFEYLNASTGKWIPLKGEDSKIRQELEDNLPDVGKKETVKGGPDLQKALDHMEKAGISVPVRRQIKSVFDGLGLEGNTEIDFKGSDGGDFNLNAEYGRNGHVFIIRHKGQIRVDYDLTYRRNTPTGAVRQYQSEINNINSRLQAIAKSVPGAQAPSLITLDSAKESEEYRRQDGNDPYSEYEQGLGATMIIGAPDIKSHLAARK